MFRLLHCFVECASRLKLIFGVIVSPVSKALVVSQPGVLCFGFPLSFQHVSDSFSVVLASVRSLFGIFVVRCI